jgi:DNA-binding NarL/FixJ family response regulator
MREWSSIVGHGPFHGEARAEGNREGQVNHTDIAMPESNGLEMLLALTHQFLDAKVIAISGVGGEANVLDRAKLLGARRTFHKPFSMPQLLDAVRYELEH